MLRLDNSSNISTTSRLLLSTIVGNAKVINVTPLRHRGVQIGIRYTFDNGLVLDKSISARPKISKGVRMRYSKKKQGYVSYCEIGLKQYYKDISNVNIAEL